MSDEYSEFKNLTTEELRQAIESLRASIRLCSQNLSTLNMYLNWIDSDIKDLFDRKVESLSDQQIGAEVRALINRRNNYMSDINEHEQCKESTNNILVKAFEELMSRKESNLQIAILCIDKISNEFIISDKVKEESKRILRLADQVLKSLNSHFSIPQIKCSKDNEIMIEWRNDEYKLKCCVDGSEYDKDSFDEQFKENWKILLGGEKVNA